MSLEPHSLSGKLNTRPVTKRCQSYQRKIQDLSYTTGRNFIDECLSSSCIKLRPDPVRQISRRTETSHRPTSETWYREGELYGQGKSHAPFICDFREREIEGRAFINFGFRPDASAVTLDDAVHNGQADARAPRIRGHRAVVEKRQRGFPCTACRTPHRCPGQNRSAPRLAADSPLQ